jgi:hypothetical protein
VSGIVSRFGEGKKEVGEQEEGLRALLLEIREPSERKKEIRKGASRARKRRMRRTEGPETRDLEGKGTMARRHAGELIVLFDTSREKV